MRNKKARKLTLSKTTLTRLSRVQLEQAIGVGGTCTCNCTWAAPTISGCPKPWQIDE